MNYRIFAALIILSILFSPALAAIGGSQQPASALSSAGAPQPQPGYIPPGSQAAAQYGSPLYSQSQRPPLEATAAYSAQAPPPAQQAALQPYAMSTASQSSYYYGGTYMPWSQFTSAFQGISPAFWMLSSQGWTWYAQIPLGGWVQELMYVPTEGQITAYEIYPSGMTQATSFEYASPGYQYIWFYADVPGRHVTIFTVDGVPSNAVMVDVSNQVVAQPTGYYPPVPYYDDYSDISDGNSFGTIGISTGARAES
ncbi:MAG TPA: hypothetical protein VN455_00095 [Methanotrichaceae archaeon]|nr:hypothetical protein [Methanotrichaceae archaeon]